MSKRQSLKMIAAVLVSIAALAFLLFALFGPRVLRVAVGPVGDPNLRVVVAFIQALQRERAGVRLKLVLTDGPAASARAFQEGKAELAVVRSDISLPTNAATVAILRRDAAYFIARPESGIETISDLKGKRVGLLGPNAANAAIMSAILRNADLSDSDVTTMMGSVGELRRTAQEGEIDAAFVVAPTVARLVRVVFRDLAGKPAPEPAPVAEDSAKLAETKLADTKPGEPKPGEPKSAELAPKPAEPAPKPKKKEKPAQAAFVPVAGADALAEINPAYDTIEIAAGVFGGEPAQPQEATTTLAVTHRLVARRSADESVIAELTRLLFTLRPALTQETQAANLLELPTAEDRGSRLPAHPGTIAYAEGETKTFFERYGDWIYLAIMGLSLLGSVAAALFSRVAGTSRPQGADLDKEREHLLSLIGETAAAGTLTQLEQLEQRVEAHLAQITMAVARQKPDTDTITGMEFLIRRAERVLARRRHELSTA